MVGINGLVSKRGVIEVVDEIFTVFENVRSLLVNWNSCYHMTFIREVMRLQQLEAELNSLGFDDDFVTFVLENVYNTVFRYNMSLPESAVTFVKICE